MSTIIFGGITGLLLGLAMQAAGMTDARGFREMVALRRFDLLKTALAFLGFSGLDIFRFMK